MRYWTFIAPISLLAIPATANAADCQPVFVSGDQTVRVDGVEIGPLESATRDFQLRVRNAAGPPGQSPAGSDSSTCGATIRIARTGTAISPDFPRYELSAPGNGQIEILPNAASGGSVNSDVVIANAPPGPQGRAVPFRIAVPTEWGLRAATYSEDLELLLIDPNGEIADRSTLTVTIDIPPAVSLRLKGAVVGGEGNGPAQVNLGNLSSSSETYSNPFSALILSTAPYAVRFDSANQGHLLHEDGREQIPYRLYFDNMLVDLAGSNEFSYLERTPRSGADRPMRIVVPPVTALAGRYSDRITIMVTAL